MSTGRTIIIGAACTLMGVAGAGAGAAQVPSAIAAAPSACRPANHVARITSSPATPKHRHYRVTLTSASGYQSCKLAGSPTDARFYHHGAPLRIPAGQYGPQGEAVTFGPGRPVHFDIQVPNGSGGPADEASFTLRTPDGVVPGESTAKGVLSVAAGTAIGPVRPGA
jgi:hypothetical protein